MDIFWVVFFLVVGILLCVALHQYSDCSIEQYKQASEWANTYDDVRFKFKEFTAKDKGGHLELTEYQLLESMALWHIKQSYIDKVE